MTSHKRCSIGRIRAAGETAAMMAIITALGGAAAHAQGGEHPPLMPSRDVTVDYEVKPQDAATTQAVRVYFAADGARLRVDAPEGAGATILNRTAQQVTVVLNHARVYTQFNPKEGIRNPFLLDISMQFTKKGTATIAGINCTQWAITSGKGNATACVTDDGVILQEDGVDADGLAGHLQATTVTYAPIASTIFEPPSDYQKVSHHPFGTSSHVTTGVASSHGP